MKLSIEDIVKGTKGKLAANGGSLMISGASIDSRTVGKGNVFFPFRGEHVDAHDFLPQVIEAGCDTIVVKKGHPAAAAISDKSRVNLIEVEDPAKALIALAKYALTKLPDLKKIAVTGSTGKTGTRDMLYYICSEKYKCARNIKNYNNNIGLPLTILSLDEDTEVAVLEMGMDHLGEIAELVDIAEPDIGIITNVHTAHIEKLGSRENIFKAKMEITSRFGRKNTLIIREDDDLLTRERASGNYKLLTAGDKPANDYVITNVADGGEEGVSFTLEHGSEIFNFRLPVPGRHNAENAGLAIAAAGLLGISMEQAQAGLLKMQLTEKRLNIRMANGIKIIDDTYNAGPDSMKAGLDVLAATKGVRHVAVLGDMGELGEDSEKYHRMVGEYAKKLNVDELICIGTKSKAMAESGGGVWFADKGAFIAKMREYITLGDVVLVKASRAMEMEKIVKELLK